MTSVKTVFILIGLAMIFDGITSIVGTVGISRSVKIDTENIIEAKIKKDGE